MNQTEILDLYDDCLAESYERQFLAPETVRATSAFELSVIGEHLGAGGRYLDVACGTGWFLSQFRDHPRAGLDLSPAMLARARAANPGVELRQADLREDQPDWHGHWDVISCLWFAYCYLDTVGEVEQLIARLAKWTSPGGAVLLPVCAEGVLAPDTVRYRRPAVPYGGEVLITGLSWTWRDPENGKLHRDLIAPHTDHLIEAFSCHFRRVELLLYPGSGPGRAILGREKRVAGDTRPAEVHIRPAPDEPTVAGPAPAASVASDGPGVSAHMRGCARRGLLRIIRAAERRLDR